MGVYLILRVDDVLKRAWFISILHLTKGYWQEFLTLTAKEKMAFRTLSGH